MDNIKKYNIYNFLIYFTVLIVSIVQLISILNEKPFWLDEWYILSSLKFRTFDDFFVGPLDYNQSFPRIYLFIIKYFTNFFDYNYISLRIIPFTVQILAILIYFNLFKKHFKWPPVYVLLASFLIISLDTSVIYFSQIKHYSMEIFMSAVALYQYYNFGKEKTILYYLPFFLGPFFSYTYPILISPLFIIKIIDALFYKKNSIRTKYFIIPSILFFISLTIFYLIDFKYVMAHDTLKWYWSQSLANYLNIKSFFHNLWFNFFDFFSIIWPVRKNYAALGYFNFFIKTSIALISLFGLANIIVKKKNQTEKYVLTLFAVMLFLYLARLLPVGPNRLNCSFIVIVIYCFIFGTALISKILKNTHIARTVLLVFMYLVALIPLGVGYRNELMDKNAFFSRSTYENFGDAISKAYEVNADIYISADIPLPWEPRLALKTHTSYKVSAPKNIFVVHDMNDLCVKKGVPASLIVFINSSDKFKVTEQNECSE